METHIVQVSRDRFYYRIKRRTIEWRKQLLKEAGFVPYDADGYASFMAEETFKPECRLAKYSSITVEKPKKVDGFIYMTTFFTDDAENKSRKYSKLRTLYKYMHELYQEVLSRDEELSIGSKLANPDKIRLSMYALYWDTKPLDIKLVVWVGGEEYNIIIQSL